MPNLLESCPAPSCPPRAPSPPAVRAPAKAARARRWRSLLSVAVQQAVGHTALGRARALPGPARHADAPALDEVLHLADPDGPSRLPLR